MRPQSLEEVRGQAEVLRPGSPLRRLIEAAPGARTGPLSAIIWGPPGTGKTTLAHLVAAAAERRFVELSAVTAGVKDVRVVMDQAARERDLYGRQTVLFLDEIHRFTKSQQDALLPGVENRQVVLVAATTENPSFSVIAPLLSRSILVSLTPLSDAEIADVMASAVADERGLGGEFDLAPDAAAHLVRVSGGDARRALTALEAAAGVALDAVPPGSPEEGPLAITLAHTEQALAHAAVRYDRTGDQHYDVASALIKSMRGSDVDAALHYLARMLEAGEDPRFIARRIVIAASEDVGMADPTALQTAVAAMHAVAQIGMPEARIILAQAVVHNALAPKSNAAYVGINEAIADVRGGRGGAVPVHLRGSGYAGAARLGHGVGYQYSHDGEDGVVRQQYLPDDLEGATDYYRPTRRGFEERLGTRWEWLRGRIRGTSP
jgi:putative ATPase